MKYLNKILLILLSLFFLPFTILADQKEIDSLLVALEQNMQKREYYDNIRKNKINELKQLKQESDLSNEQLYQINKKIIKEYSAYSFDSTLRYIEHNKKVAKALNNQLLINETRLQLAYSLASSGHYKQSEDLLLKINSSELNKELLKLYYNCYRKVYSDLDYFSFTYDARKAYAYEYKLYTDSLIALLEKQTDEYLYSKEWELLDQKKYKESLAVNSVRLADAEMGTEKFSYVTFQRALIYEMARMREKEKKYLIISAISDIKAARKDNISLTKLAKIIYYEQKVDKAYEYIKFSFEDAIFFNSKVRSTEITKLFSLILEAFQLKKTEQQKSLYLVMGIITILAIILALSLISLFRQKQNIAKARNELTDINSQLKEVNDQLENTMLQLKNSYNRISESNSVKEAYIGNFIKIYSEFIDKLNDYRLMVKSLVVAKKHQELLNISKNDEHIEIEINKFYSIFDKAFLDIYPEFVEEFNSLLKDDEHITLKKGQMLNTELRIFALIRIGITDSSKIAHLLRYSVNTIYNYRAKVKNKAKEVRDNFEDDVREIGTFK
ncbi:DUF6377 domain-containing protein [Flammeovirga sp. SubArs3]|uniref:DUF6377 domain-containing protein n=1 Tax=Flammeovirga sp. SubArs3 TaxID=2995316 RepID=UPI00248C0E72|nr:DUF6377 domain-containing protein [Flammeovirga sp. SubArs3]